MYWYQDGEQQNPKFNYDESLLIWQYVADVLLIQILLLFQFYSFTFVFFYSLNLSLDHFEYVYFLCQ